MSLRRGFGVLTGAKFRFFLRLGLVLLGADVLEQVAALAAEERVREVRPLRRRRERESLALLFAAAAAAAAASSLGGALFLAFDDRGGRGREVRSSVLKLPPFQRHRSEVVIQ